MKNINKKLSTKIKIIGAAVLCAGIISAGSFAFAAANNNGEINIAESIKSTFQKVSETATSVFSGFDGFKGKHIKIANLEEFANILGITEEEFAAKIEEKDFDIKAIFEEAGKLDEYNAQLTANFENFKAKMLETIKSRLDKQVSDGKITQAEADAQYLEAQEKWADITAESLEDGVGALKEFGHGKSFKIPEDLGDLAGEFKLPEGAENFSFKTDGKHSEFGFGFGGESFKISTSDIANILGITEDELKSQIESGKTIKEILEESGKYEEYKAEALNKIKENMNEMVADGKITQEQADSLYAKAENMLENGVSSILGGKGHHGFGFDGKKITRDEVADETDSAISGSDIVINPPEVSATKSANSIRKSV